MKDEEKRSAMNQPETQQGQQPAVDSANNEVGPTEKLREDDTPTAELSVPGAQNPDNESIKDESNPNTE